MFFDAIKVISVLSSYSWFEPTDPQSVTYPVKLCCTKNFKSNNLKQSFYELKLRTKLFLVLLLNILHLLCVYSCARLINIISTILFGMTSQEFNSLKSLKVSFSRSVKLDSMILNLYDFVDDESEEIHFSVKESQFSANGKPF